MPAFDLPRCIRFLVLGLYTQVPPCEVMVPGAPDSGQQHTHAVDHTFLSGTRQITNVLKRWFGTIVGTGCRYGCPAIALDAIGVGFHDRAREYGREPRLPA